MYVITPSDIGHYVTCHDSLALETPSSTRSVMTYVEHLRVSGYYRNDMERARYYKPMGYVAVSEMLQKANQHYLINQVQEF